MNQVDRSVRGERVALRTRSHRSLDSFLPAARIATRVHTGYDADQLGRRNEVDAVRKPAQQGAAAGVVDDGKALGRTCDLGQHNIDGAQELGAEAGRTLPVPECGLSDVCLGGRRWIRTRTTSHASPAPGSRSKSSSRSSSSAFWASVSGRSPVSAAMLSQRSSASWMRSATVSSLSLRSIGCMWSVCP